jgi:hypothetical protein
MKKSLKRERKQCSALYCCVLLRTAQVTPKLCEKIQFRNEFSSDRLSTLKAFALLQKGYHQKKISSNFLGWLAMRRWMMLLCSYSSYCQDVFPFSKLQTSFPFEEPSFPIMRPTLVDGRMKKMLCRPLLTFCVEKNFLQFALMFTKPKIAVDILKLVLYDKMSALSRKKATIHLISDWFFLNLYCLTFWQQQQTNEAAARNNIISFCPFPRCKHQLFMD